MNARTLLLLSPNTKNIFTNSVWAGGGAIPTGWAGQSTGTSAPAGVAPDGVSTAYRQTATLQRPFLSFNTAIAIGATGVLCGSIYIDTIFSGTFTVTDLLAWVGTPVGSAQAYWKNGAFVATNSPVAAGDRIACILTAGGTAGSVIERMGVGVASNFTGDLIMSRPQCEATPSPRKYRATL